MLDRFHLLFDYERWANDRVLASLQAAKEHGQAVRLFAHILAGQEAWIMRLEGQDSKGVALWPPQSLAECAGRLGALDQRIRAYLKGLTEADLSREIVYRNQTGNEFRNTPLDILTHLGLHSQHHRGQIALQLRQLGQEPAVTDFIAFRRP
ncbi:MAG: damage-inducible protein DinB [Acidobacteria bacterium]|nr:damage-inducible protein DinB [Acidobacteriota bacterium]